MGPCCWAKHLNSLSEHERARETMRGYGWYKTNNMTGDIYTVVTPEHIYYQIDIDAPACECIAFQVRDGVPCKHILYIRREIGWTAPDATSSPQDGQGAVPALTVELLFDHYANVWDGAVTHRVGWLRPYCTCSAFRQDREICVHIRAAQDEAHRLAWKAEQSHGETLEETRARVKADIDEIFDER